MPCGLPQVSQYKTWRSSTASRPSAYGSSGGKSGLSRLLAVSGMAMLEARGACWTTACAMTLCRMRGACIILLLPPNARGRRLGRGNMQRYLSPAACLPHDHQRALLIGRIWMPQVAGPVLVHVHGDDIFDLSQLAPTCSHLLELDDPVASI